MKKTFVILTMVLAMLAAPVFAEITASGDADLRWGFNADSYSEYTDNDLDVNFGITVGEYSSVNVQLSAINDLPEVETADGSNNTVTLDNMTVSQDVTGALGLELPVTVAVKFGIAGVGDDPVNYAELSGYCMENDGVYSPDSLIGQVSLGMDAMTLRLSGWQDTVAAELFGNVADVADVSVYYFMDGTAGMTDTLTDVVTAMAGSEATYTGVDSYVFGINGAASVMDGLTVGAEFEMVAFGDSTVTVGGTAYKISDALDVDSISMSGFNVAYTMDALTAGLSITNTYCDYDEYEMMENTSFGVTATYGVSEMISVFGGVNAPFATPDGVDMADALCYEAGASAAVDGVTYYAGYTLGSSWTAYDAAMTDSDGERAGNAYFKVKASF